MTSKFKRLNALSIILFLLGCWSSSFAKNEEWTDPLGNKFKAEPAGIVGPLALFKSGATNVRRIPLHFLSDEDCVRLDIQLKSLPLRAADWSKARSKVSYELVAKTLSITNGKLASASFAGMIEPEVYIVFYVDSAESRSWDMLGSSTGKFSELQKQFPGFVAGVLFGLNHGKLAHKNMAETMNLPWLITDYDEQVHMETLKQLMPGKAPLLLVLTRNGTVLFGTDESTPEKVAEIFGQLTELLKLMQPGNSLAWGDRLHYFTAVQKARFRTGETGPLLVGDPISPEALIKHGVKKFSATVQIAADGTVTAADLEPGFEMPEKLAPKIVEALKRAICAPAVKNGECVAGSYTYHFPAEQ